MACEFEVCWAPDQMKTVSRDSSQTISETVSSLIQHLKLPMFDAQHGRIAYGLFRDNQGERLRILDSLTLSQARICGQVVYIANVAAPWWVTPAAPASRKRVTDQLVPRSPNRMYACHLHLAPDCTIVVQGDQIELDRMYLWHALPPVLKFAERARVFAGYESRLMRVSRGCHCRIHLQGWQWHIQAYQSTYLNDHVLRCGQTAALDPPGATVVLGKGGWEIRVKLVEL